MENQKRGMDPGRPKIPNVKGKSHKPSHLTVTVMRSVGKIRSFEISRLLIIASTLFFITFILASIFVINSYFHLTRENKSQLHRIKLLETDLVEKRKVLNRSKKHLAMLEDYIYNIDAQKEMEVESTKSESQKEKRTAVADHSPKDKKQKEITKKVIDVTDVGIQKQGTRMTVDFKLVNLNPGEDAVGGYIHIIARSNNTDSPREWNYPKGKLENGVPVNYRRGLLFLIQRFKPIQGKFNLTRSSESPSSITILVYNRSGSVILEKEFEVSNVS